MVKLLSIGNLGGFPFPVGEGGLGPAYPLMLKRKRISMLKDLREKIFMLFNCINQFRKKVTIFF
jgi:hypothetical protein